MNFKLHSSAFGEGETIPQRYTAEGAEISPPLSWSGLPEGTRELALLCEDPDAPFPKSFVHWIAYGIPTNLSGLPEGLAHEAEVRSPLVLRQGQNSKTKNGFTGPLPPFFHGPHRYFFRLFALNSPSNLHPGANREELVACLNGKVIGEARLIGHYTRSPEGRVKGALKLAGALAAAAGVGVFIKNKISPKPGRDKYAG